MHKVMQRAITLRNLPPHVINAIRRRAKERRISLNRAVITLLEEGLGVGSQTDATYHELDDLGGSWAREEAAAFDTALREQRSIDPDVWR